MSTYVSTSTLPVRLLALLCSALLFTGLLATTARAQVSGGLEARPTVDWVLETMQRAAAGPASDGPRSGDPQACCGAEVGSADVGEVFGGRSADEPMDRFDGPPMGR